MRLALKLIALSCLSVFIVSSIAIVKKYIEAGDKVLACSGFETFEYFSKSGKEEKDSPSHEGSVVGLELFRTNDSLREIFSEPKYSVRINEYLYFPSEEVKSERNSLSGIYAKHWMPIKFTYSKDTNIFWYYQEFSGCMVMGPSLHRPFDTSICKKTSSVSFEGICSEQSRIVK